ncbi:unnamed protein product [Nezara viridula]|uniref:Carboxylic ester hydrolase n=1 Tax=Nezara viridula TaxID=85310 RepID=A0A9P0MPI5_NEZVI|nr:unnamed protein product [Nezara viridula]
MRLLYLLSLLVPVVLSNPELTTSQGRLRGRVLNSRNGRKYFAFNSIPYGQPPVANLRFMPPLPAKNWTGTLDATKASPICYQWDYAKSIAKGQEDCLYLNVYTPKISNLSLPVMIYIYGGGFKVGDAGPAESSQYFMDEDVVLVIPNYRLDRLGFFSLEDEIIPGNMGLKDQALALEWVRKEITAFGGNPDLITVFGNSAGGASAHYLCSAPRLSGQIKGCISQSGVGGAAAWALSRPGEARAAGLKIVKALGCPKNEILSCLQHKSAEEVSDVTLIPANEKGARPTPVIEPPSDHAIITSWPPKKNDFPWIAGTTADEGMLFTGHTLRLKNQSDVVERIFDRFTTREPNLILAGRKFGTEAFFLYPTLEALKHHNGPKYFYIFDYIGGPSYYEILLNKNLNITGVSHHDDFPYLFYMPNKFKPEGWPGPKDILVSQTLIKIWVAFAKEHLRNPTIMKQHTKYIEIAKEDLNNEKYKTSLHASHCMIFSFNNGKVILEDEYYAKANVLMQMRFDGHLGFPGGLVDEGETPEEAVTREMEEEMAMDRQKLKISAEVMGIMRIPLYTMIDGYRGFPAFLDNCFIGNSKEQLIYTLILKGIMTKEEIDKSLEAKPS